MFFIFSLSQDVAVKDFLDRKNTMGNLDEVCQLLGMWIYGVIF